MVGLQGTILFEKTVSPSTDYCPQLRVMAEISLPVPISRLGLNLALTFLCFLNAVTTTVDLYMQLPSCVQNADSL